jgi:hypothetical protein
MRLGANPEVVIWDWCLSRTMQLIHADGIRNGARFAWRHYFEPSKEMIEEFEKIANQELEDL